MDLFGNIKIIFKNMKDLKDYKEYIELFNDDLVLGVRKLLIKIENKDLNNLEDSFEHNYLKEYFNKFSLYKRLTEKDFNLKLL